MGPMAGSLNYFQWLQHIAIIMSLLGYLLCWFACLLACLLALPKSSCRVLFCCTPVAPGCVLPHIGGRFFFIKSVTLADWPHSQLGALKLPAVRAANSHPTVLSNSQIRACEIQAGSRLSHAFNEDGEIHNYAVKRFLV